MTAIRFAAAVVVAASVAFSGPARAQPKAPEQQPAADPCSGLRGSAVSAVACELARGLGDVPAGALVVSAPIRADVELERGEQLSARLARLVAGRTGGKSHPEPVAAGAARALASTAGTLVFLQPELKHGELRVTADVIPIPKRFWDRVRDPRPDPTAHAFSSRPIDAELRTFLPVVPLVAERVDKARIVDGPAVALACGDITGDGNSELIWVGRRRLRVGVIRSKRFVTRALAEWSSLSPIHPTPLREPIGTAVLRGPHRLDAGLTDRARGVRLDGDLKKVAQLEAPLPWPPAGCIDRKGIALSARRTPCAGEGAPDAPNQRLVDAVAGATITTKQGAERHVRASRTANGSTVELRDDGGRTARVTSVGAQLAVGDVDGDGQPEIISGADTRDPGSDAVVVRTWTDAGSVSERYRLAVPKGVRALALCPARSTGRAPIAVATGDGVWLIR